MLIYLPNFSNYHENTNKMEHVIFIRLMKSTEIKHNFRFNGYLYLNYLKASMSMSIETEFRFLDHQLHLCNFFTDVELVKVPRGFQHLYVNHIVIFTITSLLQPDSNSHTFQTKFQITKLICIFKNKENSGTSFIMLNTIASEVSQGNQKYILLKRYWCLYL